MDVQKSIIKDVRLSRAEVLIVLFLTKNGGAWYLGQEKLGNELGLSRQTIHKSIGDLKLYGYIEKDGQFCNRPKEIKLKK